MIADSAPQKSDAFIAPASGCSLSFTIPPYPATEIVKPSRSCFITGTRALVRVGDAATAALNFVMSQTLGGGVTRSLALDAHGKSLSSALLDLEVDAPPENA